MHPIVILSVSLLILNAVSCTNLEMMDVNGKYLPEMMKRVVSKEATYRSNQHRCIWRLHCNRILKSSSFKLRQKSSTPEASSNINEDLALDIYEELIKKLMIKYSSKGYKGNVN